MKERKRETMQYIDIIFYIITGFIFWEFLRVEKKDAKANTDARSHLRKSKRSVMFRRISLILMILLVITNVLEIVQHKYAANDFLDIIIVLVWAIVVPANIWVLSYDHAELKKYKWASVVLYAIWFLLTVYSVVA